MQKLTLFQTTTDDHKKEIRNLKFHEVRKLFNKPIKPAYKELKIIKSLKQDQSIIILQTDKSNKLAIFNRYDYIDKMENGIKGTGTKCEEIMKDPIDLINDKVNDVMKHGPYI